MKTVIAAIDNTPVARRVAAAGRAAAALLGASAEAVHVLGDGNATAEAAARSAGLPLRTLRGDPAEVLIREAAAEGVAGLVIGARRLASAVHPVAAVGSVTLRVITEAAAPVLVVPAEGPSPARFHRVLVPMDESPATAASVRSAIELADDDVQITLLHVYDEASLPAFDDQPQYESEAWAGEFTARYAPAIRGDVVLELRVGSPAEEVLAAAAELPADLIALGWGQDLSPNRAGVVRAVLRRSRVPVVLMPLSLPVRAAV